MKPDAERKKNCNGGTALVRLVGKLLVRREGEGGARDAVGVRVGVAKA